MSIETTNHPTRRQYTGLHRKLIVIELLSDTPIAQMSITQIVEDFQTLNSSARFEVIDDREISKTDMTALLIEQGTDPEFLIPEQEADHDAEGDA